MNDKGGFGEGGEKTPWDNCLVRPDVIQRILRDVLICNGRLAKRVTNKPHDGMVVSHLPIPQSMFGSIINAFSIHRSISRVINRNTSAVFSAQSVKDPQTGDSRLGMYCCPFLLSSSTLRLAVNIGRVVYNCRSSASYPDDLALSVTFCTKIRSTQAVFYGCSEERIRTITRRLETSDCAVFHPLTLPTIFAEIERDRQIQMVEKALNKLITRVLNIVNHPLRFYSTSPCEKSGISQGSDDSNSIELWLNISHIKNGLETWRQQLLEMLTHADMLSEKYFSSGAVDTNKAKVANIRTVMPCQQTTDDKLINDVGKRIKYRLRELVGEYDEKIRACAGIMDGMTLATQMVSAVKVNASIQCLTTIATGMEQNRSIGCENNYRYFSFSLGNCQSCEV